MKRTLVFFLALAVALSSCFIVVAPGNNAAKAVGPLEWTQMNNGFADGQHGVGCLAINPANTQIVYAGKSYDGVYKTTNGGSLWVQVVSGLTDFHVRSIAVDPVNPEVVYAGTNTFLYKSTNGGVLWTAMDNGLVNKNVSAIVVDPTDTQIVYAATTNGGMYKSTSGGSVWTQQNVGLTTSTIYALSVAPSDHLVLYASGGSKGIFKSSNGGNSWALTTLTYAYANNSYLSSVAIDPADPQVVYAGADSGWVYKSVNGGSLWAHSGVVPGSTPDIESLVIDPGNPQVIYAAASSGGSATGGVYMSTDGGGSWSSAGLSHSYLDCLAMDPTDTNVIYAGTDYSGVYKSEAAVLPAELILSASWNLVSVSVPLPVSSIPGLQAVYGYHDGWSIPTTLVPGEAYWVQVLNAVTVPLSGTPSTAPLSLTYLSGWQLLGNPFDVPLPVSSIANHALITTCYSYGPAWGILNPATDSLQPGKGYWIQLSAATTLVLTRP